MPTEYLLAVDQIKESRNQNRDKYGSTREKKGTLVVEHAIEREIHRMPEFLHEMIDRTLSIQEMKDFQSKKMSYWFAKTYPEFAMFEIL